MPGFRGVRVDEPAGKRWDLALRVLETGEAPVRMSALTLYRDAAGPAHDGLIHIEVDCPNEPDRVTEEMARAAMARAVPQIQAVIASDPRFGELLDRFGSVYEYVYDYGMGRVLVAVSQREGDLEWRGN
jgi:hypothetical protein